jgi:hypothetical protein
LKAISLSQPYASLVASGKKTIETRTWATKYRGPILICASQNVERWDDNTNDWMPCGVALATATIVNCRPMTIADEAAACCKIYPKAVAWELVDTKPLEKPFPVKGKLGVFDVDVQVPVPFEAPKEDLNHS